MFASICITILVVPAVLFMLLTALITRCYTMDVPQGQNAMGLGFMLIALIAAAVSLVLGSFISLSHGSPWWIAPSVTASQPLGAAIALGIGMASVGTLIAWMDRRGIWVPPASILTAIAGPILLSVVLLVGAWRPPVRPHSVPFQQALAPTLGLIALSGYLLCAVALLGVWKHSMANRERLAAAQNQVEQEKRRRASLTPIQSLEEDFARMSADAPLWVFIARLPDEPDPALRTRIIARALHVPDFDAQLAATLADNHPRYRHGALALILAMAPKDLNPQWIAPVQRAIDTTASQIAANPEWLTSDSFSNPNPLEHVVAMVKVVAALHAQPQLADSLDRLRAAISSIDDHLLASDVANAFDQTRLTAK